MRPGALLTLGKTHSSKHHDTACQAFRIIHHSLQCQPPGSLPISQMGIRLPEPGMAKAGHQSTNTKLRVKRTQRSSLQKSLTGSLQNSGLFQSLDGNCLSTKYLSIYTGFYTFKKPFLCLKVGKKESPFVTHEEEGLLRKWGGKGEDDVMPSPHSCPTTAL